MTDLTAQVVLPTATGFPLGDRSRLVVLPNPVPKTVSQDTVLEYLRANGLDPVDFEAFVDELRVAS